MAKKMKYVDNHHSELEEINNNLKDECAEAKEILEALTKKEEAPEHKEDLNDVWKAVNAIINLALPKEAAEVSPMQKFRNFYSSTEKVNFVFTAQMDQKQMEEKVVCAVRKLFCPYDYLGDGNERYRIDIDLITSVLFEIFKNEKVPASDKLKRQYSYEVIWGEDIIKTRGYTVTQYTLEDKASYKKWRGESWTDINKEKSEVYQMPDEDIDMSKEDKHMPDELEGTYSRYYSEFYQIGIEQLYTVMKNLIANKNCRDKSFVNYFNSYQSFCSMLPFSEAYMVEKLTGLYLAIEIYMCSRHLMKSNDKELSNKMGRLTAVISGIESLEVRLYVAEGIQNILMQTEGWEIAQINYLLETIIQEIEINKEFFNLYYHRVFHIMLFAFAEKEYWEKLKKLLDIMEDRNETNGDFSYNKLRSFVRLISQGESNVNNNFQDLYLAWRSDTYEYKWFNTLFSNIKKGEPTLYRNIQKDPEKEKEIYFNIFAAKISCPEGFQLIEY